MADPDDSGTLSPADALEIADEIVAIVADLEGFTLDYTVASLEQVDEIIGGFHEEQIPLEKIESTIFRFGCYVGEVFVRNAGATWRTTTEDEFENVFGTPLVIDLPGGLTLNPLGKVLKRFENGEEDNLPFFYRAGTQEWNK